MDQVFRAQDTFKVLRSNFQVTKRVSGPGQPLLEPLKLWAEQQGRRTKWHFVYDCECFEPDFVEELGLNIGSFLERLPD